jgi:hypothetical protein
MNKDKLTNRKKRLPTKHPADAFESLVITATCNAATLLFKEIKSLEKRQNKWHSTLFPCRRTQSLDDSG